MAPHRVTPRTFGLQVAVAAVCLVGVVATGVAARSGLSGRQDDDGLRLVDALGCAACHAGVATTSETVRARAPSLENAGNQYEPAYLFSFLLNPRRIRQNIGATRMPSFALDERESLALTLYLETRKTTPSAISVADPFNQHFAVMSSDDKRALERDYNRIRRANDEVTAEAGAELFVAFNCAGCHVGSGVQPIVAGPDLSTVGRYQGNWLVDYLTAPKAVRPFGFYPGSGARMPNFALSGQEVIALANHLRARSSQPTQEFAPQTLSQFAEHKARRLIRDRLPCLGCHRLDGEGGRIGPDLSNVGARLTSSAVYEMLLAPQRQAPGSIMPYHPMPEDRIALIASFLSDQSSEQVDSYLSPLDFPTTRPTGGNTGADLYTRYCSACHGTEGKGDGFNVPYLPVIPTVHADSNYMSTRPDDTLFDGIHAGAYILGKNHRMPAFGWRLTSDEIRSLVAYMRELCNCVGPGWSRDGGEA